jgi:lipopolysaccharide/colanic/teichoic acid biosynthesis glycosyltransferase
MGGTLNAAVTPAPLRRRGKEARERLFALLVVIPLAPVFALCAAAIKLEALIDRSARGPVFFRELRVSRGEIIGLYKFRTLPAAALAGLGEGPTHIAKLETKGQLTRAGRLIRKWYLDELPQLWNIVRGDMFLIGTRPWPLELYDEEMERGITRKRDMPAGLVGPVQSSKGDVSAEPLRLDLDYWDAFRTYPAWKLFVLDLRILMRSAKVQLEHKGL